MSTDYNGWPDKARYNWSNKSKCWTPQRWTQIEQCKTTGGNPKCLDDFNDTCDGTKGPCQAGACEYCLPSAGFAQCASYFKPYGMPVVAAMCNCSDNNAKVPGTQVQPGSCIFSGCSAPYREGCKSQTLNGLPSYAVNRHKAINLRPTSYYSNYMYDVLLYMYVTHR